MAISKIEGGSGISIRLDVIGTHVCVSLIIIIFAEMKTTKTKAVMERRVDGVMVRAADCLGAR